MAEELRRDRSKSREAKGLDLYTFGKKSQGGRSWQKGWMEGGAIGLIAMPIWVPIAEGEGLRLPSGGEWIQYALFAAIGILILFWYRTPRAQEVFSDPRTHRPHVDRVESDEGLMYQGVCDCGWSGAMSKREKAAVMEANRHTSRRHWPRWTGRFGGT
jgi:hypothetical protein